MPISRRLVFLDLAEMQHGKRAVYDGLYDHTDGASSGTLVSLDLAAELSQGEMVVDRAHEQGNTSLSEDNASMYVAARLGYVNSVKRRLPKTQLDPARERSEPVPDRERSPLHAATRKGFTEIVQMLLEFGLAVDFRDVCHRTPLHLAVLYNQVDIANILLKKDADPNARDHWGETPLSLARVHGRPRIFNLLLDHGAQPKEYERYLWRYP